MLNGVDVAGLRKAAAAAETDPSTAERYPRLLARWTGGDRSRAEIEGKALEINGPGQMDPMQLVLAGFAGCEIDAVATRAAAMGLTLESLEIEIDAHFDVRSYFGLAGPPPGYDRVGLVVRVRAPGITPEQIRELERAIAHASPVGATLAEAIPVAMRLEVVRDGPDR